MKKLVLLLIALNGVITCTADALHGMVDAVYARLTLEERVAQICAATAGSLTDKDGRFSIEKAREKYPYGIGHICQFACNRTDEPEALREFVREVQDYFVKESSSHIPVICHEEVISGLAARTATTYPQQIGIACSWDAPLLERKCRETSEAMRAVGATFALSPMADVCYNSNWTRLEEGYGESGYLGAVLGTAFVKGLQENGTEAACTKHFLGYGVIGGGHARPWRDIYEEVILPHEAMIKAGGAAAVMTSYDSFKGELAVTSPTLIQDLLRGYIGFDGTVVSDYGALGKDIAKGDDAAAKKRTIEGIMAGNDVDLPHGAFYKRIVEMIKAGEIDEAAFEKAVKNSLRLKARLGLLEMKNEELRMKNGPVELDRDEWRKTAYELACESVVLLKNDGVLPIGEGVKVALVGPNANSAWAMLGDYTYQCMQAFWRRNPQEWDKPHIVTLKEGLDRGTGNGERVTVIYERGCGWSNPGDTGVSAGGDPRTAKLSLKLVESADPTDFDAAVRAGKESDVIICAMGENFTLCGESRQRSTIRLAGDQEKLVKAMIATGKPVVLVLFGGRNQVIADMADGCAAVVQAWYPGEEGGNAVADILFGKVNPSGKLAMTYPKTEDKSDLTFGDGSDTPERVQWPFGHGLTYTTFEYGDVKVVSQTADDVKVAFTIKNSGKRDGVEIAQIYLTQRRKDAESAVPRKRLRGFARVALKAGEEKRVLVTLPAESFARWEGEKKGEWVIDESAYEIAVGASAWNIKGRVEVKLQASRFPRREKFFATIKEDGGNEE